MTKTKIYPTVDGLCSRTCLEVAELYNLTSGEQQFCESTPEGKPCGVLSFRKEMTARRRQEQED